MLMLLQPLKAELNLSSSMPAEPMHPAPGSRGLQSSRLPIPQVQALQTGDTPSPTTWIQGNLCQSQANMPGEVQDAQDAA